MSWKEAWSRVIFSDEKKFNLDGPDGWAYYWHDLRKDKLVFSKRNFGGGSMMIWVGLSRDFKAQLYVLDGNLDSTKYIALLDTAMLPLNALICANYPAGAIFQQDNARAHTARATSEWLEHHHIQKLDWVSRSPDLNIMENVFGILCREVYRDSKHYDTVGELRDAVVLAWEHLTPETIGNLVDSMAERIFDLISKHGAYTHY
jgi:hypothetical protein